MSKPLIIRWLAVCLIPLATLAVFTVNPPEDAAQHLINGIILACEATFLFKFVLFDTIKHHLKQEFDLKRQTSIIYSPAEANSVSATREMKVALEKQGISLVEVAAPRSIDISQTAQVCRKRHYTVITLAKPRSSARVGRADREQAQVAG